MQTIGHFINGSLSNNDSQTQEVYNPSTGEVSKKVALGGEKTIGEAVAAAKAAFPAWSKTPPLKRARVMFKFKALLEQNADEICRLIGEEHGKISHDAAGELQRGIENVEYACGAPELLKGEQSLNDELHVPTLAQFGVQRADFDALIGTMCEQAFASGSPNNNPRIPTLEEMVKLYTLLWNDNTVAESSVS